MIRKNISILCMIAMIGATAAYAGDKDGGKDGGKGAGENGQVRAVSWDDFKFRCQYPEQSDIQRAPQNIFVQCHDTQTEFVAAQPGSIPLSGARMVQTAVTSTKFQVGGLNALEVPVLSKGGSCLRFKEVRKTIAVNQQLSCEQVLGMKGSPEEYCVSILDSAKGQNPKLVEAADTGRVIDTCQGYAQGGDGKGGAAGKSLY